MAPVVGLRPSSASLHGLSPFFFGGGGGWKEGGGGKEGRRGGGGSSRICLPLSCQPVTERAVKAGV